MNRRERQALRELLDTVRVNRTMPYHWVFARYGTDGEAYLGVYRWPADASAQVFDLRRDADRSRILEGQVWFLDGEFVFRCPDPTDAELRYGFERNLIDQGFRDAHDWLREGRVRLVQERGDPRDPRTWFDDPARGERVAAELEALGVGGRDRSRPKRRTVGDADGLDLLAGLDAPGDCGGLDELDGLSAPTPFDADALDALDV